jgi:hypothetical protein
MTVVRSSDVPEVRGVQIDPKAGRAVGVAGDEGADAGLEPIRFRAVTTKV